MIRVDLDQPHYVKVTSSDGRLVITVTYLGNGEYGFEAVLDGEKYYTDHGTAVEVSHLVGDAKVIPDAYIFCHMLERMFEGIE